MLIYVTGKSGSGKSTFSKYLAKKLNYKYIDVDKIGHKIYECPEIMDNIYKLFGKEIDDENGKIDRKKLGKIIFNEQKSKKVKKFFSITWKYMKNLLNNEITDNSVVDWILLPHTEYWKNNALRILIKSKDESLRLERVTRRDNLTKEYAKLRDKASINYNENEFDFVFVNKYDNDLKCNVLSIIDYINSAPTLTVLGTQSPYAKENNACPSFLFSFYKKNLLIDCGSGSHRFFNMDKLTNLGIIISHFHRDHYNDLYNYMYSSLVMNRQNILKNPINIFIPNQPKSIYEDIKNEKLTFSNITEINDNKRYLYECYEIHFLKTIHSSDILSYAIKVVLKDKIVVYTGDCSYKSKDDLIKFAQNADILICESSLLVSHGFPKVCNH